MVTVDAGVFRGARSDALAKRHDETNIGMECGREGARQRARVRRAATESREACCEMSCRHWVAERPNVTLNQRENELRF
jgi:hypothetical protein